MGTVIEYFPSKQHVSEFLKLDYSPKYKIKLSKQKIPTFWQICNEIMTIVTFYWQFLDCNTNCVLNGF